MLENIQARGIKFYLHLAIGLFLLFLFGHILPPIEPLTAVGMQVLGVFIGVIWLWCFVGFLWPSLLALVAFGLTDLVNFPTALTMSFGHTVPVLLLFSMVLFGSPQHVGATKYITRFFLTRKVFNNRPIVFAFVFFFATYALSVAVNVTPSLILMWSVLYGVLKELGYQKGDKFTSLMLVGTFLGSISGQASLPFTGSTLAILSSFEAAVYGITGAEMPLPTPQYMLIGFVFSTLILAAYCLLMKLTLKPNELAKVAHVNTEMFERDPLPPMSALQKANFIGMLGFVFLMLLPWALPAAPPAEGALFAPVLQVLHDLRLLLNSMGAHGVAIFLTALMCLIQVQGQPILDFKAVAEKSINWDIYVMVAVAMAIANGLTHADTGVLEMMVQVSRPILGGHSTFIFYIVMLLIGIFVTSFTSAMVIGIALMPVLVYFTLQTGGNLPAIATTTTLLLHYSIILPSASVFAAMLWSNDQWITRKEVFKYGAFIVVIATIVAITVIMPLAVALF